jgi:tetratricopeptide (TPR) repeat protein
MNKSFFVFALLCAASIAAAHADGAATQPAPEDQTEDQLDDQLAAAQQADDWPRMDELAKRLIVMVPERWQYAFLAGQAEVGLKKPDEAFQSFDAALKAALEIKDPASGVRDAIASMYTEQGMIRVKEGRNAEAVDLLTKAIPYSADQAEAWVFLSLVQYYQSHDYAGALVSAAKAIALKPAMPDPYFVKGMVLVSRSPLGPDGKHVSPDGRQALQHYLKLAPNGDRAPEATKALSSVSAAR